MPGLLRNAHRGPPSDWFMRVPDEVKDGVVYLGYRKVANEPDSEVWGGTGFMVGMDEGGLFFEYLVTAHHILTALWDKPHPVMRYNDSLGKARTQPISFPVYNFTTGETQKYWGHWLRHPSDPAADVAVMRYAAPRNDPERVHTHTPIEMLLKDSDFAPQGIGIGDETFTVGLFYHGHGQDSNSPIVRIGNLSMLPKDRIQTSKEYGPMEAFLVEVRSISGISGAPVYVRETVVLPEKAKSLAGENIEVRASGRFFLLGVAHAHWDVDPLTLNEARPTGKHQEVGGVNVGIAVVTPAKKIFETLYHPEFVKERAGDVAAWAKKTAEEASVATLNTPVDKAENV